MSWDAPALPEVPRVSQTSPKPEREATGHGEDRWHWPFFPAGVRLNANFPTKLTLGGITIDFNPLPEKADSSIRSSREPLSKITDSSDWQ
jgi:hypothetical protein